MKHIVRLAAPVLGAALAAAPAAAQLPRPEGALRHEARPTVPAIAPGDLRTHLYVIADDSMGGREAGARGNWMGTRYIAEQAERMGLRPAGEGGTFFQEVPLVQKGTEGVRVVAGGAALEAGRDFVAVPRFGNALVFGDRMDARDVEVVYGGRVGEPSSMISPEDARGKLVVFAAPLGPDGQPGFAFWAGGRSYARYEGAAGLAFATLDRTAPGLLEWLGGTRTELAGAPDAPTPAPAALIVSTAAAERLLGAPLASLAVGARGGRATAAFSFYQRPVPHAARNVLAVVPGSDPALRDEYVVLSAHNDHVGYASEALDHDSLLVFNRVFRPEGADQEPDAPTPETRARFQAELAAYRAARPARLDSVYNGADDDASGTAALLEIAEHLMASPPRRSVLFAWVTAEEMGLYGSEHFTDHPTVPREAMVANLNADMLGRGMALDTEGGGVDYLQLVGSRRLSTQLGDLIETVNRERGHGFTFDYSMDADGHPQNIYCRSDHANFARFGIPVTFFTTGGHPEYHMLTDEAQYIDFDKLAAVTRLLADVTRAVADLDARPVVDKPVPAPDAPCRQ